MPRIFCVILGEEGGVCRVEVDHDATGDDLNKAIKQENPDIMCSARKIRVFLAKDDTTWLNSTAARAVPLDDQGLPRGYEEIRPEQQLSDPRLFGEDFNPARGVIHILATLPPFSCTQLKPQALKLLEAVMVRILVQVPTTVSDDNRDFKDALCKFYGCRRPNGRVRCMLLDEALPQSLVVASHLFRRENKDLAEELLKIADVNDAMNGLLLFKPLKYAFDRYQISFIGDDKGALRLKLFDPTIRDTRLVDLKDGSGKRVVSLELLRGLRKSTRHFDAGTTFGNVDGKALAFTGLKRPFYSCLNFQARVARALALKKEWVEPSYDFGDFWSEEASINDKMELIHQSIMHAEEER